MALDLRHQLELQRGDLKPNAVNDPLIELVHASTINFANEFSTSYKQFETQDGNGDPINQEAQSYLNKVLSASNRALSSDSAQKLAVSNVMASIIAMLNVTTPELIEGATEAQWEGFINDNIQKAVELFAQVRIAEKTAYDNLP